MGIDPQNLSPGTRAQCRSLGCESISQDDYLRWGRVPAGTWCTKWWLTWPLVLAGWMCSSWTHHRKRYLKLFEKRRCHPTRDAAWAGTHKCLGPTPRWKAAPKVSWVIQSCLHILAAARGADELPSGKGVCPIPTACTATEKTQKCHQQSRVRPGSAERGLLLWLSSYSFHG